MSDCAVIVRTSSFVRMSSWCVRFWTPPSACMSVTSVDADASMLARTSMALRNVSRITRLWGGLKLALHAIHVTVLLLNALTRIPPRTGSLVSLCLQPSSVFCRQFLVLAFPLHFYTRLIPRAPTELLHAVPSTAGSA